MGVLNVDFETRSTVDLKRTGVYPYARHPHTGIWCMAYAFDGGEPKVWKEGEPLPQEIVAHVEAGGEMRAWNAQFERVMWNDCAVRRYGFPATSLEQWHDTAAEAAAMALPRALGQAAGVLGVAHQKDAAGHRLMLQMCRPRRMKPGGEPIWWNDPAKLERLYAYCAQDVRTESAIVPFVRRLGPTERAIYVLDQRINDRGVRLDVELANAAKAAVEEETRRQNDLLHVVTNGAVESVTRVGRLKAWMTSRGVEVESLAKGAVAEMLEDEQLPTDVLQALTIRAETAKSSVAKIDAMLDCVGDDERMRGLLLYHGASTGRWAGRLVQPQNFPRPTIKDIESFIPVVLNGDAVSLDVISSMLRSMLVAAPGHDLIAADFSAIEARVLAWVAGQDDLIAMFERGDDPYKEMASFLFDVPVEEVTDDQRHKGKTIILGCGYQMGAGRFASYAGVPEEEAETSVSMYRARYSKIKAFWPRINAAAIRAVAEPGTTHAAGPVKYSMRGRYLWCRLPSRRLLCYSAPRLVEKKAPWGEMVTGVEASTLNSVTRKWERFSVYGGLLTENVVQAIARDLMAQAMLRTDETYPTLLSVHDEIVGEVPKGVGSVEDFEKQMSIVPEWATGCPVKAKGWRGERYRK